MADDEIFVSPSKKRDGVMNISPTKRHRSRSATRQSVPTISRGIIATTPKRSGRSGLISPLKRSNTDLDRSARKRAILSNYERLMDDDYSDLDEDMTLADKIIEASRRDGGTPILLESDVESDDTMVTRPKLEPVSPSKSIDNLYIPEEELKVKKETLPEKLDFVPTPIPKGEAAFVLQKKFDDRALFLDGFEGYFEQHKTKVKTSGNTMSQLVNLEYEEYSRNIKLVELIQLKGKQNLMNLHRAMFHQWYYELLQGFNLCFYGIGSKRSILIEFVQDFLLPRFKTTQCCVVNGYNTETTIRELLSKVVPILLPDHEKHKLSRASRELVSSLLQLLPINSRSFMDLTQEPKLILLINNIDAKQFRDEKTQNIFSSLAQLNSVWIISTIDYVNSPLLWDSSKLSKFKFVWHNLTTFNNYNVENSFRDILSLGKSSKFSGSKGAKYVLSSLTRNAKSLFRILLSNQLTNMEDEPDLIKRPELRGSLTGSIKYGLELKMLFQLCIEEFFTSNEVSFRTMLHEFVEHKMCNLVKDDSGTEMVFIPFNIDELQTLLEDDLMD